MISSLSPSSVISGRIFHPASKAAAPTPGGTWTQPADSALPVVQATSRDGRLLPALGNASLIRMQLPLSAMENHRANQMGRDMVPRHRQSRHFDAATPSRAVGPSSGTRYTFTCCPDNDRNRASGNFTVDDMFDEAFKTGTRTSISLTSRGDDRHSEYYKENKVGGKYSVASSGRPAFTTMVGSRAHPVTASIFINTVTNNRTGERRTMNMVHVNGWPDQTALPEDFKLTLLARLRDNLRPGDLQSVLMHCSQGRNRTGSMAVSMEAMDAAVHGRRPDVPGKLAWFRGARVADAVNVPGQLRGLGEAEIRLGRLGQRGHAVHAAHAGHAGHAGHAAHVVRAGQPARAFFR